MKTFGPPRTRRSLGSRLRLISLTPLLVSILVVGRAWAEGTPNAGQIKLIADTADSICGSVNVSGGATSEEVQGRIDAQLEGIASKLLNAGVSGTGKITSDSYKNVLREQLGADLQNLRACRLHVYDSLMTQLFPAQSGTSLGASSVHIEQHGSTTNSPPMVGTGNSATFGSPPGSSKTSPN